jgi:Domain of unknown function (DUF6916)
MQTPTNAIDQLTADDFVCHLGRKVCLCGGGPDLVLDRIDRREFPGWEGVARKPFSLIIRGPRRPVLPEGFYPIEIADGPTLTLYVIPILTAARDHQEYQVVFN